jgi:hypothetical protein
MNVTQGQFQLLGFAILFCVVLVLAFSTAMNSFSGQEGLILKTEFVRNGEELIELVGKAGSKEREGVKSALIVDTIGFVPIYFLLFMLMIWFLVQQSGIYSKHIALTAFLFAIATVVFDLSENLNLYKSLNGIEVKDRVIFISAIGKWICFFLTAAILSSIFWQPNWFLIIASLFLLGSILGFVSLALQKYELIQFSVSSIISGIIIVGVSFAFFSANAEKIFNGK